MAIQQINLGSMPLGAGGDTQRAANEKINQNFSNTDHAASRLVGRDSGQLVEYSTSAGTTPSATSIGGTGWGGVAGQYNLRDINVEQDIFKGGISRIWRTGVGSTYAPIYGSSLFFQAVDSYANIATNYTTGQVIVSTGLTSDEKPKAVVTLYSTGNTTKDVATGFLKASSPVLHVYNDSITKIHEAEQLDIVVDKKGVGHYEIHGTTGLRKNDGWNMSPPRDLYGNVLCMIDVTEKDDVVILKTYKRKFNLELAAIVHDWDNPIDIPDGACVEFRFNDLPQEQLDEPIE